MENNHTDITQEDIEMGKYIYTILISQPTIIMSWGFESPIVIKLGLKFKVNGFKLKGIVEVKYNEGADLFDLTFYNNDKSIRNSLDGIYFDDLVDVIDGQVERVSNYNERVNEEYSINNILSDEE